jgi:tRNA pseudouridine65 synthase/23S rRNA pseudouridine1911/1915/1917 synthase
MGRVHLDKYASQVFPQWPSPNSARKAAARGELRVDDRPAAGKDLVQPGSCLQVLEAVGPSPPPFPLALRVAYEDAFLAVVEKPPGYPVSGNRHRTVEHALTTNLQASTAADALSWPRPVHRLDAPTGGLLVVAKARGAQVALGQAFEERRVHKRYRAIVLGRLDGEGEVIGELDGRPAHTRWRAVSHTCSLRTRWVTTLDLWPLTGRTHQLRRHAALLGHPVLGDAEHGDPGHALHGKGLFLWSVELDLVHPVSGEPLRITVEEPAKFESFRRREARRFERWNGVASVAVPTLQRHRGTDVVVQVVVGGGEPGDPL